MRKAAALLVAIICWVGLAVQFSATYAAQQEVAATLWVLARFFTVLTNLLVAVLMTLGGLLTLGSVWLRRPWAPWAVLTLLSFKLVIDLFNYALNLDRLLLPLSALINGAILLLVLRWPAAPRKQTTASWAHMAILR